MDETRYLPSGMPPVDMTDWLMVFAGLATGLDLSTGDDRATYRVRVQDATEYRNVGVLRNIAHQLGVEPVPIARRVVQRKIADAVITVARTLPRKPVTYPLPE